MDKLLGVVDGRLNSGVQHLAGNHKPDTTANFYYKLGIILDNELYAAPRLLAVISDSAQIAGSFTQQEVEDFVQVLNRGSPPARIRLVEKKDSP